MISVLIREAIGADSAALERLIDQLGFEVPAHDIPGRLETMAAAGNAVFLAEADGKITGCLTTSIMEVIHRPAPIGRISMLVVEEEFRGQGVGRALVGAAHEYFAKRGIRLVEVTSRINLPDAHNFYERLGYEKTSVRLAKSIEPGTGKA